MGIQIERQRAFAKKLIQKYDLDLSGLIIMTEAATNAYRFTPIMAALSGAEEVYAVGSKEGRDQVLNEMNYFDLDNIYFISYKSKNILSKCDIITNSGGVRPITRKDIKFMKSTAVIPLMYELWELRKEDLDIDACLERGIPVIGIDEHGLKLRLFDSIGFKLMKLMFEAGLSVYNDKILLFSSGLIKESIVKFFSACSLNFDVVPNSLDIYDTIIVAEFESSELLIGKRGVISVNDLKIVNPLVQIIYTYGNVNKQDIIEADLEFYPNVDPRPYGYMAVSSDYLGYKPVMELNVAGLKIGQIWAEKKIRG